MELLPSIIVYLPCFLMTVLAAGHLDENPGRSTVQVPLMLEGTFATGTILRSLNKTTLFIAAFNQDFVIDVQKSRENVILHSTVETIYRAINSPFRRKTEFSEDCFYHGVIRNKKKSSAFLDACTGTIRGSLHIGSVTYIIAAPSPDGDPPLHKITRLTGLERRRRDRTRQNRSKRDGRRWRRETRQIMQPDETSLETKYLELYIVHDYHQFVSNGRDLDVLRNKSLTLAHLLGKVYRDLNIQVSLVGSEVWNEGDEIRLSSEADVYDTLDKFLSWRENELLPRQPHDFALLISGTTFMHHMKAHTYHGEMCSQSFSAAILEDYTDDVVQVANDAAHSIGHNVGLRHDTPECTCEDPTGYCVMDVVKRNQPPTQFSSCSKALVASHAAAGRLDCLNNLPVVPRGPLCGNGLVEAGEECDCGEPQECSDVCCEPLECQRRADCSRRSSQTLAAAEVVTAPIPAPEPDFDPRALGRSGGDSVQPGLDPVDEAEAAEERFNTINNGRSLTLNIRREQLTAAPTTRPKGVEQDVDVPVAQEIENVVATEETLLKGAARDIPVISQGEAAAEELVQEADIQGIAQPHTAQNLEPTDGRPLTNSSPQPTRASREVTSTGASLAACDVASALQDTPNPTVVGDHASVEEIMDRLGIPELTDPPAFIVQPRPDLYLIPGQDLELDCEASGLLVISYIWLKDGEEIDIMSDPRMALHRGNLTIQFPDSSDIGIYQCLVSNIYSTIASSKTSVRRAVMGRFSSSPGTIREAHVGDSVILACNPPISMPAPLLSWALNSSAEALRHSRRVSQDPKGNLVIASVEEGDSGLYHCIVVNEVMGRKIESPRINLIVKQRVHPPVLVYSPEDEVVGLAGEQLSLKCIATGNPVPQIWWERDEGVLPFNRTSHTSFGQELIISPLGVQDGGVYRCIVDNGARNRVEKAVTLSVKAAPFWTSQPESLTVPVGASATFSCLAGGDPTPSVTWLINNQPAEEVSQSLQLEISEGLGQGTLTVNQTGDVDSALAVQCVASNRYGTIIGNAHLTVLAMAAMFQEQPPSDVVVVEGDSVRLPCRGLGAPSPTINWFKNAADQLVSGERLHLQADGPLTICTVEKADEGNYKCVVDNKYGYETSKTQLTVRSRTRITSPPVDTVVTEGDTALVPCSVTFDPALDVTFTWMTPRGLEVMVGSGGEGSLRVTEVTQRDQGQYTCTVSTALDSVSASASLTVQEKAIPVLCGNGVVDSGEECDGGPYNVSQPLHPCCTKYCEWREDVPCRDGTACCKDCQLLPPTTPCESKVDGEAECYTQSYCTGRAPTCPTPTPAPNNSPCREGGACLDGQCIPFCEVHGLESCQCTAEADACVHCCVQDFVCSPFIDLATRNTHPLPTSSPVPCGNGGTCSQGVCVGSITTTTATTTAATSTAVTTTTTATTITTTKALTPSTTAAPMTSSTSPISKEVVTTQVPSEASLPSRPSDVTMTTLSSPQDIQLSWSVNPDSNEAAAVSSYEVEAQTSYSRGSWDLMTAVPANQTQARFNLYPYMTYRFRVSAVGTMGRSEPGEAQGQYFTPPAGPVSNPEVVQFEVKEDGSVMVSWEAVSPELHGAPLFSYKVLWRPLGTESWNEEIVHMFQRAFTIPGSREDGKYEVTVQSTNAVGPGPEPTVFTYGSVATTKATESTEPPYVNIFVKPPEMMQVLVGSRLSLPCQSEGSPTPSITWSFNGDEVLENANLPLIEVDATGQLTIDPVDLNNTGMYECQAVNPVTGERQTATSDISVVAPMLVFTSMPPSSANVLVGDHVELACQGGGFPMASMAWRFKKKEIDYGADIYMAENNSIIIPSASVSHSGLYQCIISNGLHNVKVADSQLNVREPLEVIVEPSGILTTIGSQITLPCEVTHDHPLQRVYWTRDDVEVYESRVNGTGQGEYPLLIDAVAWEDRGMYRCVAETELDSDSDSVQLVIQTLPDPPSDIRIQPLESEALVTFDPPFDGNSPITSYIIEYSSPEAEVPWQEVQTIMRHDDSTPVSTLIQLPPYFGYYVRAMSVNEFGESEPSAASGPAYTPPRGPDRNPSGVETEVLGGGSNINVTWEPLSKSEVNGPGFYYIVDLRGANQRYGSMVTVNDFRQSHILLDVDPSLMPYEIMVQSGNELNLGPIPEIVTAGIEEAGLSIPDAPTGVMVDMTSPTSINVTWMPLPMRPTYGTIYGYRVVVQATEEAIPGARPLECLSPKSNCEIHGLHRGLTYRVTVIASGDGGEGFSSMPLTVSVPAETLPGVKKLKVRTWARTMLIKWEPPESGDHEIQGYTITYGVDSGGESPLEEEVVMETDPLATSTKVGSLTPGTSYRVSVAAFNDAGNGEIRSMAVQTKPSKESKSKRHHS